MLRLLLSPFSYAEGTTKLQLKQEVPGVLLQEAANSGLNMLFAED